MRRQCIPGSFFSAYAKEPGDEANTAVAVSGSRAVPVKTTRHKKDHITVILTGCTDGKKMKPYIVFKRKGTRLIKELQKIPDAVLSFSSNGWMNDSLTADYLIFQ